MAEYKFLDPIKCLVKVGDFVIPGQPIAVFEEESQKYTLLFSVFYLDYKSFKDHSGKEKTVNLYQFLFPKFLIDKQHLGGNLKLGHSYNAIRSEDVILKKLSKKEIKRANF